MSEQENQNPAPPRPTIKTSAVPLKKETVRITLRPQSPEGAEAPAPPPPAASTPPLPAAPAAPAPPPPPRPVTPTVPLAPPPRPTIPGAPPPPAAGAPPRPTPPSAVGSKTIPLSQPPARPTTPMVGKQTTKLTSGSPNTQPLPRATVKLPPTPGAAPSSPISSVKITTTAIEEDDEVNEGPLNVMGWIALVASIAVLILVLSSWDKVEFFSQGVMEVPAGNSESRTEAIAAWHKAAPPDDFKLPTDFSPFDKKDGNGGIISNYEQLEPDTPVRPAAP